jgi:hypothetical protein
MLAEMPGKYINIEEETDTGQAKKKIQKPTNQKAQIYEGLRPSRQNWLMINYT